MDSEHNHEIQGHNQETEKNWFILLKIVSVLQHCRSCKLGIRGHDVLETVNNVSVQAEKDIL
jgi:hypothetical protein